MLTKQNNLKNTVSQQHKNITYRTSAVFPAHITNKNDLYLVFLNYWTIKNKINLCNLTFLIKIYDNTGKLIINYKIKKISNHNQFSIRSILKRKKIIDFDGSAHIEINSKVNLRFQFPAITAIYQSGPLFSAVHSAGRIKNKEESKEIYYNDESNWSCKYDKNITPFFHYFNGPILPKRKNILVKIFDKKNRKIKQKKVDISHIPKYGSKIFTIDNIFGNLKLKKNFFIKVNIENNSVFSRMIVGNYFKDKDFYEVTHSFPVNKNNDFINVSNNINEYQSILAGYTNKDLKLNVKSFPTNDNPGNFNGTFFSQKFNDKKLKKINKKINFDKKKLNDIIDFSLKNDEKFLQVSFKGKKVPSRFTANFEYKVKNVLDNKYSTNITNGATSIHYPLRKTQWGHGYVGNNFESFILIRNSSLNTLNTQPVECNIDIYYKNKKFSHKLKINSESSYSLNLKKLLKNKFFFKDNLFLSWLIKFNYGNCDSQWVSYNKKTGSILGDHSF